MNPLVSRIGLELVVDYGGVYPVGRVLQLKGHRHFVAEVILDVGRDHDAIFPLLPRPGEIPFHPVQLVAHFLEAGRCGLGPDVGLDQGLCGLVELLVLIPAPIGSFTMLLISSRRTFAVFQAST